jgi:hypothetical protein
MSPITLLVNKQNVKIILLKIMKKEIHCSIFSLSKRIVENHNPKKSSSNSGCNFSEKKPILNNETFYSHCDKYPYLLKSTCFIFSVKKAF